MSYVAVGAFDPLTCPERPSPGNPNIVPFMDKARETGSCPRRIWPYWFFEGDRENLITQADGQAAKVYKAAGGDLTKDCPWYAPFCIPPYLLDHELIARPGQIQESGVGPKPPPPPPPAPPEPEQPAEQKEEARVGVNWDTVIQVGCGLLFAAMVIGAVSERK